MYKYFLIVLFAAIPALAQEPEQKDTLATVTVKTSSSSIRKSQTAVTNTQVMTSRELLKAACCNLAESFETNPSIDVNFTDALTGAKQIKMLGLTSPYLMITEENIPSVRGASQTFGMTFTPGTWVESIQITKGAGSVVNGYESISGQINTELIKPATDIPFFFNMYGSTDSRLELNGHFNERFGDKWSSSLFVHGNMRRMPMDQNDDGFLDNPISSQINVMNRWQYNNAEKGWVSFITARVMNDEKLTGEVASHHNPSATGFWKSEINTQRYDIATKIGYVFPDMPYQSIGFQNAYSRHVQDSYFGNNIYNIAQDSFYSNLILNSIINNTRHKFAAGINFTLDRYRENVIVPGIDNNFDRIDNSLGAFAEYTFDNSDNFSLIAGMRADYHNRLGVFATPRLHVRYNPWADGTLRASAGRGKRAANIFAENQQLFASARSFSILDLGGKIYGLDPEIAWNYGISFSQKFKIFGQPSDIGFDLYRTDFSNQAVVDLYANVHQVSFYNLTGNSSATSLQVDFNYEPLKHLNLRTAYKYYDIETDYLSGTNQRPLQARHRLFANVEFATHIDDKGHRWKFDTTWNWTGEQRLPTTEGNSSWNKLPVDANPFSTVNAQMTRSFSSKFEMYAGVENLTNYRQDKPILGSENPFGAEFDASIIYAPVFGRMMYAGLRFKVK
ncbi:TonB-dependent receptor plug domain-containing protein [Flavobacterium silvaticum]|uniref:TonB-dependent receptor n=1 Tax=Flavobacterium silvaticum TaxID=1852020 RepID=A0A972FT74_9FLAO|nr:TonB-dependent receptor [Flavobacterium silvaticum]NMH27562.1 TonB-dependent receptor [Flavobacterium silvaticum]